MLEKDRLERQDQLIALIFRIAKLDVGILSPEETLKATTEFKKIYEDRFRHQYSSLFPIIKVISEGNEYDSETLLENLRLIRECVENEHAGTGKFNALYAPLLKLMDHINLELSRINVFNIDERRLKEIDQDFAESKEQLETAQRQLVASTDLLKQGQEQQEQLHQELDKTTKVLAQANKRAKTLQEQAENLQMQLVSVLSIFAAIVIAFSGGVSFLGNAIASIQNTSIYKSVLICLLCGLVLFNLIFLMMYIVGKIINRSIFVRCDGDCKNGDTGSYASCNCGADCLTPCSGFKRIKKRLPYVFWVNIVGLLLCLLDVIAWYLRIRGLFPFNY